MSTLYENIWNKHIVATSSENSPSILYIDLHLIHEVTSPQAFEGLRKRGLSLRRPDRTVAVMDHSTITTPLSDLKAGALSADPLADAQLKQLKRNCEEFGVKLYDQGHENNGIVHVVGPELGLTQPGMTIVCGDSHTSTHGAFGALAFGIGTSEVEHVFATQCLLQKQSKNFSIEINGTLGECITAKDIILYIISKIGIGGGTGHVFEFRGSAITSLSMEGRMTICNMSIEGGARAGMIAPDDTSYEYLANTPFAPKDSAWDQALDRWKTLPTSAGSQFETSIHIDAKDIKPMVTFGTNPGQGINIGQRVPDPTAQASENDRKSLDKALAYMDLKPGDALEGKPIQTAFLGSCTNSRLSDLRAAATILKGRSVSDTVRMLVVPGSERVKKAAESEGLDQVFKNAGAQWRNPGCSMCIAMNGDLVAPGDYAISTSNRNFEGRQGPGSRTFLASPLTVAASAVKGCIADVRKL